MKLPFFIVSIAITFFQSDAVASLAKEETIENPMNDSFSDETNVQKNSLVDDYKIPLVKNTTMGDEFDDHIMDFHQQAKVEDNDDSVKDTSQLRGMKKAYSSIESYTPSYWFSEENGGYSEDGAAPINAIECSGRYCDNKRLWYSPTLKNDLDNTKTITLAYLSEEPPGGRACPPNTIVSQIKCAGDYCDNMALSCSPLRTDSVYTIDQTSSETGFYFSEEQDGLSSRYRCSEGYFVNGINCSGSYCDNIQLKCIRVVPKQKTCSDSPINWYDSDGPSYDCEWYSHGTNCIDYGSSYENKGKVANQACCVCGGGTYQFAK